MKMYTLMLALIFAGAAACQDQGAGNQAAADPAVAAEASTVLEILSPADFAAKMAGDVQLIDVRRPEEFAAGHIDGAVNYNFLGADFNNEVAQLDKEKPVLLYCRTGRRSGAASKKLKGMGFQEIYDLQGGYVNWSNTQGGN